MSAPDIDQQIMDKFASLRGNGHLTILLGAGASAPSGLPTWDEFARTLAVSSGLVSSEEAARLLLQKQDPTIVLEAAQGKAGAEWPHYLNQALFGEGHPEAIPSPLHFAAVGQYLADPTSTTLSTLNYDTLLEVALQAAGCPLIHLDTCGESEPTIATVHHLHGALFEDNAYSPIVGYRDYAELIANPAAWQQNFLSTALDRGPLLLAGTSYRDADIRHWLHLIVRDNRPRYPALVTIVREGLNVDQDEFDAISDALSAEWESIGLTALQMQDLADVALVLRELQASRRTGYKTPQQRAQQVWTSHSAQFAELQLRYSSLLSESSRRIAKALHVTAHRASLWLADGEGQLAQWATDGLQYRHPSYLKRVPTGHDSPWIAGEAIASEEIKLQDVERNRRIRPTWRSVLAIPVFVTDRAHPKFVSAVLTFGLSTKAGTLIARQQQWQRSVEGLSEDWGSILSQAAFSWCHSSTESTNVE